MGHKAKAIHQSIEDVRRAWNMTPLESGYRDPQWFRLAAANAAKAGIFPKRFNCVTHTSGQYRNKRVFEGCAIKKVEVAE